MWLNRKKPFIRIYQTLGKGASLWLILRPQSFHQYSIFMIISLVHCTAHAVKMLFPKVVSPDLKPNLYKCLPALWGRALREIGLSSPKLNLNNSFPQSWQEN